MAYDKSAEEEERRESLSMATASDSHGSSVDGEEDEIEALRSAKDDDGKRKDKKKKDKKEKTSRKSRKHLADEVADVEQYAHMDIKELEREMELLRKMENEEVLSLHKKYNEKRERVQEALNEKQMFQEAGIDCEIMDIDLTTL